MRPYTPASARLFFEIASNGWSEALATMGISSLPETSNKWKTLGTQPESQLGPQNRPQVVVLDQLRQSVSYCIMDRRCPANRPRGIEHGFAQLCASVSHVTLIITQVGGLEHRAAGLKKGVG